MHESLLSSRTPVSRHSLVIGHVGAALGAKGRWRSIPITALLIATFIPDLVREFLIALGQQIHPSNVMSHSLPWVLWLAIASGLIVAGLMPIQRAGLVVGGLVLLHAAFDILSGTKPIWSGGPRGLDMNDNWLFELLIESALLIAGWVYMRRNATRRWYAHWPVPATLVVLELAFLLANVTTRPWHTRCLAWPLGECAEAPWYRARWNVAPLF